MGFKGVSALQREFNSHSIRIESDSDQTALNRLERVRTNENGTASRYVTFASTLRDEATICYTVLFLTTSSSALWISASPQIPIKALVSSALQPTAIAIDESKHVHIYS